MNLDDAQKQKVAAWINEGLKLSDIQKRIVSELALNLTYMDVRLLVDDLKLVPKDPPPPPVIKLPEPPPPAAAPAGGLTAGGRPGPAPQAPGKPASPAGVSVKVDAVARPGALVSGSVQFSDGQTGTWYMDQMGRLGVAPSQQGYKPSAGDVQAFQEALERELSKLGL